MPLVRDPYTGRLMHVRPGDPRGHWTKQPGSQSVDVSAFLKIGRIFQSWTGIQTGGGGTPARAIIGDNTNGTPAINGTDSAVNDATGFYINYLSGTAVANAGGWVPGALSAFIVTMDLLPDITFVIKTGAGAADIANDRIWPALTGASGVNNSDLLSNVSGGIGFRFSAVGGDTNWMASSSDGASNNNSSTGVAVAADTRYILRAKAISTTSVEYYVNGTLTNTLSTNMPGATVALMPSVYVVNNTAGTGRNLRIRQAICLST